MHQFQDVINITKKVTISRVWNGVMLLFSFQLSKLLKRPLVWGSPASISVEPTTSCNLRCPECPSGLRSFTRPTGMLEEGVFDLMLDQFKKYTWYLIFYFQGEPYLNPSFLKMVKKASLSNFYTATSTNAHYLDDKNAKATIESGLDRLIISLDGTTQDIYENYRIGGDIGKVLSGTKNILKWRKKLNSKKPFVVFQFLVVKPNEHQIDEVIKLGKEIGVDDVWLKSAQIYDYKNGSDLIPVKEKYSRYKKNKTGGYSLKQEVDDSCWKMWHSTVLTWDGKVIPCCFDKDASHAFGNIQEQSFKSIWKSKKYNNFRQQLFTNRSKIEICRNCTEGSKVWL